jgi:hypothetical protein
MTMPGRANHFDLSEFMSSPLAKNIPLPFFRNMCFSPRIPARQEGASADRHETWGGTRMARWTKRVVADGEIVWSSPTLGSSLKSLQATVAKSPAHRREHV